MGQDAQYHVAKVAQAPDLTPPDGIHIAFEGKGWGAFAVDPSGDEATILRWPGGIDRAKTRDAGGYLRVTVSVDHHREDVLIDAFIPGDDRVVGTFDVRFPTVCAPLELSLTSDDIGAVFDRGLGLRMVRGTEPVWFIADGIDGAKVPDPLMPHVMIAGRQSREAAFTSRMLSDASLQPFGWMEGCVLDGLFDLEKVIGSSIVRPVIESHLRYFFDDADRLFYVKSTSRPFKGRVYGLEGFLPYAVIPRVWPDHPSIKSVVDAIWDRAAEERLVRESTLTAEGCYTLAYPLAVLGTELERDDFHRLARRHVAYRFDKLFHGDVFYPQIRADGATPFINWGRGAVWLLLGAVRTLAALGAGDAARSEALIADCHRLAAWIVRHQGEDGTWTNFLDDPTSGCDTSATAGLGAALAIGVFEGILPSSYMNAARRALEALSSYLTPDGFLTNASPENKGAEPLKRREYMQRHGPRGISQMAMGLMAQLIAALARHRGSGDEKDPDPSRPFVTDTPA